MKAIDPMKYTARLQKEVIAKDCLKKRGRKGAKPTIMLDQKVSRFC